MNITTQQKTPGAINTEGKEHHWDVLAGPVDNNKLIVPAELLPMTDRTDLDEIANEINIRVKAAEETARSAVEHALEAGALLIEAKSRLPHGQWNDWLKTNCDVAPRTAQAYMRLAKRMPMLSESKAQRVADLPLREAVMAIATNPVAPPTPPLLEGIRLKERADTDRAVAALKKTAGALRDAEKRLDMSQTLKGAQIKRMRDKLSAAMETIDKLGGVHEL